MKRFNYSHIHQHNMACQENIRAGRDYQEKDWRRVYRGEGASKQAQNQSHEKVYYVNKIPNLKHQITIKSQIQIFNDPNVHHS